MGYRAFADGRIAAPDGSGVRLRRNDRSGYWSFNAPGCRSPIAVHRFIAFQLYGEAALEAECVRHLDDNRDNNAFDNIAPGSRSDNQFDIPAEKRSLMGRRRNVKKRSLTADQVRDVRRRIASGVSLSRIARDLCRPVGVIGHIKSGKTYRDVT